MNLTEKHIEALRSAIQKAESTSEKRALRDCLYELTASASKQLVNRAAEAMKEQAGEPVAEVEDLKLVDRLIALGIQQNGLMPTLSTVEVGRALGIVSNLLGRAHVAHLEQAEMELLEAVFDHAAEHDQVAKQVRELELRVRVAMGLDQRIVWPEQELPLS